VKVELPFKNNPAFTGIVMEDATAETVSRAVFNIFAVKVPVGVPVAMLILTEKDFPPTVNWVLPAAAVLGMLAIIALKTAVDAMC
jgi:hypothetical protein